MNARTYKLDELAAKAGTSARTVRYYVQRGLLPAPQFRGKDTAYSHEHLVRLRAIRRLQERFFPLDAIEVEIARRTSDEIARIADGHDLPTSPDAQRPTPPTAPARGPSTLWERLELAPGLELSVAEGASAEVRALVGVIVDECRRAKGGRTR